MRIFQTTTDTMELVNSSYRYYTKISTCADSFNPAILWISHLFPKYRRKETGLDWLFF